MIENDIKNIRVSHAKTAKTLKGILDWQIQHQKEDLQTKKEILEKMFTKDEMIKALGETVDKKINGKLIGISEHLTKQDEAITALSAKINPLDGARHWISDLGKTIVYIGALCGGIAGVVYLLQSLKII